MAARTFSTASCRFRNMLHFAQLLQTALLLAFVWLSSSSGAHAALPGTLLQGKDLVIRRFLQDTAPPPAVQTQGYDYMCLVKDIQSKNCKNKPITIWSVLTFATILVAAFGIVLIPIGIIYSGGRCCGRKCKLWIFGKKYPEYADVEQRAAQKASANGGMPMPPKVSKFRQQQDNDY